MEPNVLVGGGWSMMNPILLGWDVRSGGMFEVDRGGVGVLQIVAMF